MRALTRRLMLSTAAGLAATALPARAQSAADTEWRSYGSDLAHTRYAPLDQVDAKNFADLEVAWRFKTEKLGARPEYDPGSDAPAHQGAAVHHCGIATRCAGAGRRHRRNPVGSPAG